MKKVLSIAFVVVLVVALASVAFADGSFSLSGADNDHVVGSYTADNDTDFVEVRVNDKTAKGGFGTVSIDYLLTAKGHDELFLLCFHFSLPRPEHAADFDDVPVVTEEPVETEQPVETEEPVETEKPVETTKPVETVKPVQTAAPSGKDSVPKTGETDATAIVIAALAVALIGAGVVVVTGKKYGKEN